MKVLIVDPLKTPYEKDIPNTLEALQGIVGGYIGVSPLSATAAVVYNDDGKLLGLPFNRRCRDADGRPYDDFFVGTFFIVGTKDDNFTDLDPETIEKYYRIYMQPEQMVKTESGKIIIVKPPLPS